MKKISGLTIRTTRFNLIAKRPALLEKLRALTLEPDSGMNYELDCLLDLSSRRQVDCKIILAYRFGELVAWALLSKENSDFEFCQTFNGFNKKDGHLFQVFVRTNYRRLGIASSLFEKARKNIGKEAICICPWDKKSKLFYDKFQDVNRKVL